MTNHTQSSLTELLNAWRQGEAGAFDRAQHAVMRDLELMAEQRMRGEHAPTIAPMDLLNEALLRVLQNMADSPDGGHESELLNPTSWKNRAHFFATISLCMRAILVDHARRRGSMKRGMGAVHLTLSQLGHNEPSEASLAIELIALDEALTALDVVDPRAAQVLHLTYFAGASREDIAAVLNISIATVDRELRFARAWLSNAIGHEIG